MRRIWPGSVMKETTRMGERQRGQSRGATWQHLPLRRPISTESLRQDASIERPPRLAGLHFSHSLSAVFGQRDLAGIRGHPGR